MGLDVYLYHYDNYEKISAMHKEHEQKKEALWDVGKEYDDLTEEEKSDIRNKGIAIDQEYGMKDYCMPGETKIEIDSSKYPDHMFKVGYFRSSYNDSGFEAVIEAIAGGGLRIIFRASDEYEFKPDWADARERAVSLLSLIEKNIKEKGALRCYATSSYSFFEKSLPGSPKEALAIWDEEQAKEHAFDGGYSNSKGEFYPKEPISVKALIPGRQYGSPCVYIIFEPKEGLDWYVHALEIVIETIDYVLAQPDKDKYYLHWSG
jgi:hypothetical protein